LLYTRVFYERSIKTIKEIVFNSITPKGIMEDKIIKILDSFWCDGRGNITTNKKEL
jgi:hypothetical protein